MIPCLATPPQPVRPTVLDQLDAVVLLGAVVLGVFSSLVITGPWLAGMIIFMVVLLLWTGLNPGSQWQSLKPWIPVALFVLIIHVFTTTAAAPLGHPSWGGLWAGLRALGRIGLSLGWLALFARLKSLDDLVRAVRWWLRPLEKLGFQSGELALVLAVALGTVPGVMSEGRRVEAVLRMRRASQQGARVSSWRRFLDKTLVVVPLMEGLLRRAEVLSLSLRTRQPNTDFLLANPPWWQFAALAFWLVLVIRLLLPGETV